MLQRVAVPGSTRARVSNGRAGFSILELVVVLLIMGIVAAATTPSFYLSLRHHALETAARRVKLDLEQARHAARMKSQPQSLSFTNATTYTLTPNVPHLDRSGATYTVDLAGPPYELDAVTVDFGGPVTVSFDGYGSANADGTIVLELGGCSRTVALDSDSGQITISDP